MDRSTFYINICGQFYLSVLNAEKVDIASERHILIIPVAGTGNVIRTIQIINPDADHCNSGKWELKRLNKLIKECKNETIAFNNIRLSADHRIHHFYDDVPRVFRFRGLV